MSSRRTRSGNGPLEVSRPEQVRVLRVLRDSASFRFEQLIDLCGVDYSEHAAGAEDRSKRFGGVSPAVCDAEPSGSGRGVSAGGSTDY